LARIAAEYLAQGRNKISLVVGLAQHLELLAMEVVSVHQLFCVSGRQQYLNARPQQPCAGGNLAAGQGAGHDEVCEHQVDGMTAVKDFECLATITGLEHLVADYFQPRDCELAHAFVVFDDEVAGSRELAI